MFRFVPVSLRYIILLHAFCLQNFGLEAEVQATGYDDVSDNSALLQDDGQQLQTLQSKSMAIKASLEGIARKLKSFKGGEVKPVSTFDTSLPTVEKDTTSANDLRQSKIEKANKHGPPLKPIPDEKVDIGLGPYILPFAGVLKSENLEMKSRIGDPFEIEPKSGFSAGIKTGYDWDYVFTEIQLSYFQNDLKKFAHPSWPNDETIDGKVDGIAIHLSSGGRFKFSDSFAGVLGFGVGGINQEVSFLSSVLGKQEEKDFLLCSHLFAGLEFRPTEHLIIGLGYRWLSVAEMKSFSSRELYIGELSFGYNL